MILYLRSVPRLTLHARCFHWRRATTPSKFWNLLFPRPTVATMEVTKELFENERYALLREIKAEIKKADFGNSFLKI
jgi:hypothetical protein